MKTFEIPLYHMRGGTSTGVILNKYDLLGSDDLRDSVLRKIMGVPEFDTPDANQITGLGRGIPTSNKLFIIEVVDKENRKVNSTLAQFAAGKSNIDWSVNCGNMSSAIPLYLIETGQVCIEDGVNEIEIFNTNTGKSTKATIEISDGQIADFVEIPGVRGFFPAVKLELNNPVGAKTGILFPTGNRVDILDGVEVTCLDVNVPMVIVNAKDMDKTGNESVAELMGDSALLERLRTIWTLAGLKMKLKNSQGNCMSQQKLESSETIPKICMVSPAINGGDISTRYFTPQKPHGSLAVSGGGCLAAACLLEGTVAYKQVLDVERLEVSEGQYQVAIENPAGVLDIELFANGDCIEKIRYERNAQVLVKGSTVIYEAESA